MGCWSMEREILMRMEFSIRKGNESEKIRRKEPKMKTNEIDENTDDDD